MKFKLLMAVLAIALMTSNAVAQQDADDSGAADSLILAWAHTPDELTDDSLVVWEVWALSDVLIGSISSGYKWNYDGLVVDSAAYTAEALAGLDFIKLLYYKNNIDSTNIYNRFQNVISRLFNPGLAAGRNHVATFWGHVNTFPSGTDSIVIDTSGFNAMLFVEGSTPEFPPRYAGSIVYKPAAGVTNRNPGNLPDNFALNQNYPNPFNPTTKIEFDVPSRAHVQLSIFNVLGQRVATLRDEDMAPGFYEENWNGTSDGGNQVASGIYFYRLTSDNTVMTKKMMLLK